MKFSVTKNHIDESMDAHGSIELALGEAFSNRWRMGDKTLMNLDTGEWGYHTPEIQKFLRQPCPAVFELPQLRPE